MTAIRRLLLSFPFVLASAHMVTAAPPARRAPAPVQAAPARNAEAPLTNADVIALVKATMPESVVLTKIRTAPVERLDTSSRALIGLKEAGASAAVIEAVMSRAGKPPEEPSGSSQAGSQAAAKGSGPTAPRSEDASAPAESGVYWEQGETGLTARTLLNGSAYATRTSGFYTKTMKAIVKGEEAALKIENSQPAFLFVMASGSESSAFPGAHPDEYFLAQMKTDEGDRVLPIGKIKTIGSNRMGPDEKDVIAVDVQKLSERTFRVRPKAPLAAGEYCFLRPPAGGLDAFLGASGRLWDFRIAPGGEGPAK